MLFRIGNHLLYRCARSFLVKACRLPEDFVEMDNWRTAVHSQLRGEPFIFIVEKEMVLPLPLLPMMIAFIGAATVYSRFLCAALHTKYSRSDRSDGRAPSGSNTFTSVK